MFKNYLKVALRGLLKNKFSSAINIFGLSIGLSSCLLIALYISHEISYDKFQQKGDRIARVIMEYKFDGAGESKAGNFTSTKVAPTFKRVFPEVENAVRMVLSAQPMLYKNKFFNEQRIMYTDPSFFDMFTFKLLEGDAKTALSTPNEIVFTQTSAKKYFGDEDPMGRLVKVGSDTSIYKVSGVIQDSPSNSQVKFDFLVPFSALHADQEDTYWDANYTTYLLLKNEGLIKTLQAKLPPFMQKEMKGQGATINFYLEPFKWIHLHSEYDGFEPNNSITYIYIIAIVGLLILVIACFTYINLSTARSIERAKEVSVRKVIGAGKGQLFWQFIGESALLCLFAIGLSYIFSTLALPYFNGLTQRELAFSTLFSTRFFACMLLIAACVTFLAGSYPAFIISKFDPIKGLKGSFKNTGSGRIMRNSLIVFQFVISVFLIVSTFIMQNQLFYIQHKKLGYDRDHVLVLPIDRNVLNKIALVKQELKLNHAIISVAPCNNTPVNIVSGYNMRSSVMPENAQMAVNADPIDEDYIKTAGLQIIAGNDLAQQDIKDVTHKKDSDNVFHFILNEAAAKALGWTPQQAIGKRMFLDASRPGYVKGVIKDFHFQSMHYAIKPLVLFPDIRGRNLMVKISGDDLKATLAFIQAKWGELVPWIPFTYRFLDDDYNRMYSAELRLGKVMDIFSAIAITLACLGLFGLSSYSIQQRLKEVTIRKVLGASVSNLTFVLSKNFLMLSLIAIAIAFPLTWYAMTKWLQGFTYRISIEWWMFAIAGFAILLIVFITVSFQSIKAAFANPVKSLRSE
jgi:putative ABC transport system permease protein